MFAGKHYTRALALGSLDEEDMTDDIDDFTPAQHAELAERVAFYGKKYPMVAQLALPPEGGGYGSQQGGGPSSSSSGGGKGGKGGKGGRGSKGSR